MCDMMTQSVLDNNWYESRVTVVFVGNDLMNCCSSYIYVIYADTKETHD